LYTNQVAVNHRVDGAKRKLQGKIIFDLKKQIPFQFFIVYYRNPFSKIIRLLTILKKYTITDTTYFKLYFKAISNMILNFPMLCVAEKK
jgi:hypothetical protein